MAPNLDEPSTSRHRLFMTLSITKGGCFDVRLLLLWIEGSRRTEQRAGPAAVVCATVRLNPHPPDSNSQRSFCKHCISRGEQRCRMGCVRSLFLCPLNPQSFRTNEIPSVPS